MNKSILLFIVGLMMPFGAMAEGVSSMGKEVKVSVKPAKRHQHSRKNSVVTTTATHVVMLPAMSSMTAQFLQDSVTFRKAGLARMTLWQKDLQEYEDFLIHRIDHAATRGKITAWDLDRLGEDLNSYRETRKEANEDLVFYQLNIPEGYWEVEVVKLLEVPRDTWKYRSDNNQQSLRRLLVNMTGVDIKPQLGLVQRVLNTIYAGGVVGVVVIIVAGAL